MIRVFVAAPTALRIALRTRLERAGLAVLGDGGTPEDAPPETDVVVLGDPERLLVRTATFPEAGARPVVALTGDERTARMLRGLPGWAIVAHEAPADELHAAVTAAAQGFAVLPAALATRLLPARIAGSDDKPNVPADALTPREREVLELLAHGLSNRRIAERLGISEHTAKFHVAAVLSKLGAASRTEAVGQGIRRGLITL